MRKIVLLAAALMIATPAAAGAQAWQVGNNSYHLYFNDLDLRSATGRAEALVRVERAAARLCTQGVRGRRLDCITKTVETSTTGSARDALRLAMEERTSTKLARASN